MKISVVIPSYNRPDDLYRCLKSLELQDFEEEAFEVIVILNAPNENTSQIFESYSHKINLFQFQNNS